MPRFMVRRAQSSESDDLTDRRVRPGWLAWSGRRSRDTRPQDQSKASDPLACQGLLTRKRVLACRRLRTPPHSPPPPSPRRFDLRRQAVECFEDAGHLHVSEPRQLRTNGQPCDWSVPLPRPGPYALPAPATKGDLAVPQVKSEAPGTQVAAPVKDIAVTARREQGGRQSEERARRRPSSPRQQPR